MIVQRAAPFDRPLTTRPEPKVEVTAIGDFEPDVPDHARQIVRAAVRDCPYPILRASVRLVRFADPLLPRPVVASALANVNGRPVRVQTTASSARAAIDAMRSALQWPAVAVLRRHRDGTRHRAPRSS